MGQSCLPEQGSESLNRGIHELQRLMQKWDERLTLRNLRFRERFIAGKLDFLIRCQREERGDEVWLLRPLPEGLRQANVHHDVVSDGDNSAMFVDVVELAECPKRIVSAPVRLELINHPHRPRGHSLYFSSLRYFVTLETWGDGERRILGGLGPSDLNEGTRKMVKGTPEVVNNVPRNTEQGCRHERVRADVGRTHGHPELLMRIGDSEYHITVAEDFRGTIKLREVLFGPFDLGLNQGESFVRQAVGQVAQDESAFRVPPSPCRSNSNVMTLLWGHSDHTPLAADLATFAAHGGHNAGNV